MPVNVKQFLARQLNDHSESPSGVVQKTYYEWTEGHLTDAISLALCYVYSLIPREFSKLSTHTVTNQDCLVEFCKICAKFVGIASLTIDGEGCVKITQEDPSEDNESNSLIGMLDMGCLTGDIDTDTEDSYKYHIVDGSNCVVKFNKELPVGAVIKYMCATPPGELDEVSENTMCEYGGLIADYALWWLFRTDSESRSNLDRARLHFEGVRDFVTNKLILEFSLTEDDYNLGRRKVDD